MKTITLTEQQPLDLAMDITKVSLTNFAFSSVVDEDYNKHFRFMGEHIQKITQKMVKRFIEQLEEK